MRTAIRIVLGLVAGLLIGAFGTAIHRTLFGSFVISESLGRGFPVGLVVALALLVCAGLFIRAAAGFNMFAAFGMAWILVVWLFSIPNSGGDVLIVDPRANLPWAPAGIIWTYLGTLLLIGIALLPAKWFRPAAIGVTTVDNLHDAAAENVRNTGTQNSPAALNESAAPNEPAALSESAAPNEIRAVP